MSLFAAPPSDANAQGLPRGEVLGTHSTYQQAREMVARLAAEEFDVKQVSIVGTDLRMVERVRGKLTYATVALRSGLQGALFGGMLGLLLSLMDPSQVGMQILATAAIGAAIWIIMGVIGMAVRKNRGGGFDSVQQLVPTSFDVVCAFESAAQAKQILRGGGATVQGAGPKSSIPVQSGTPARPPAQQSPGAEQGPLQHPVQVGGSDSSGQGSHAAPVSAGHPAADQAPAAHQTDQYSTAMPGQQPAPDEPAQAPQRDYSYPDLPDGRPQFGVRLPAAEAQELRTRILREQGLSENATGGTQDFQEPAYAKRGRRAKRSEQADESGATPVAAPESAVRQADEPSAPASPEPAGEGTSDRGVSSNEDSASRRPRYGRGEQSSSDTSSDPESESSTHTER